MSKTQPTVTPALPEMSAFFTRQKANEGIKIDLALPDGTKTGHTITVRSVLSDAYKANEAGARRRLMQLASSNDKAALQAAIEEENLTTLVTLVAGWSFPQECNETNIRSFLREAPQIAEKINRVSASDAVFFKASSPNSGPSPAQSSS